MFLSTRWGVPSFVIESLPISEINKQKTYHSMNEWGIQDDLLSLIASQTIAHRTQTKPPDLNIVKNIAISQLSFKPHVIETASSLRRNIFGTLSPIMSMNNA